MKLIFGTTEMSIIRFNDTVDMLTGQRRVNVTVSPKLTISDVREKFSSYNGDFTIEKENEKEVFTGFKNSQVVRNVDDTSDQTMILFEEEIV